MIRISLEIKQTSSNFWGCPQRATALPKCSNPSSNCLFAKSSSPSWIWAGQQFYYTCKWIIYGCWNMKYKLVARNSSAQPGDLEDLEENPNFSVW